MKARTQLIVGTLLLAAVAAGGWWWLKRPPSVVPEKYRTATIDLSLTEPIAPAVAPPVAHRPFPIARFHLTRPDFGPNRTCWLIDRITRIDPPTHPRDGPPSDSS